MGECADHRVEGGGGCTDYKRKGRWQELARKMVRDAEKPSRSPAVRTCCVMTIDHVLLEMMWVCIISYSVCALTNGLQNKYLVKV